MAEPMTLGLPREGIFARRRAPLITSLAPPAIPQELLDDDRPKGFASSPLFGDRSTDAEAIPDAPPNPPMAGMENINALLKSVAGQIPGNTGNAFIDAPVRGLGQLGQLPMKAINPVLEAAMIKGKSPPPELLTPPKPQGLPQSQPPAELLPTPKPAGPGGGAGEHIMAISGGLTPSRFYAYDNDPSRGPNGGVLNPFRTAALNSTRSPIDAAMFQDIAQGQMFQAQEKMAPIMPFIQMGGHGRPLEDIQDLMAMTQGGGGVPPSMQGTAYEQLVKSMPTGGSSLVRLLKDASLNKQGIRPTMERIMGAFAHDPDQLLKHLDAIGPAIQQAYPAADFQNYIKQGWFEGAPTTPEGRFREGLRGRFAM